ncbi:capreomycidine synthase [Streptomycetaceae bacterium NBC_01309]
MRFQPARLEDWLRDSYFTAGVDLGCSGVDSWSFADLDRMLGLGPGFFDAVVFDDSPSFGSDAVRAAVADRFGTGDPDRIMVTHGSSEGIFLLTAALLESDDEVIVTDPAYHGLDSVAEAAGCRLRRWRLDPADGFRPDMDALRRLITPNTRMVIANFPHNPTGVTLAADQQRELVELCADADAYLLWDGAFADLTHEPAEPLPDPAAFYDKCISTGTFSKAYGLPGLRFGWCHGRPDVLAALLPMRDRMTLALSPLVERLATAVLGQADTLLAPRLAQARRNREILTDWIADQERRIASEPAAGGVTIFPRVMVPDVREFCEHLLSDEDLLLVPGDCFGHPDRVRLGFGGPTDDLLEGLDRLARALAKHSA